MPTDWRDLAVRDLQETDLSYQEIGNKYGRDRDTVIKLKRSRNVIRTGSRKGSRPTADLHQLSTAHRALGIRISLYRGLRTRSDLAQQLGVSRYVIRRMEIGLHDYTLTQLQRLSTVMGQPIEQILAPYRVKS